MAHVALDFNDSLHLLLSFYGRPFFVTRATERKRIHTAPPSVVGSMAGTRTHSKPDENALRLCECAEICVLVE